ncbi:mitochondrial export translocase Oxa1 [Ophiobolus disseminans]|uniref:Mitochondrial export translocase Oxa1 n=1 Tax=Ophiobolus disseminans TaxID=1469910 RepID=A0A6A7A0Q6_9PLEO|nr:mitochondrial export translocase Oxa1 [Ophiobolus disseminans]
MLPSRGLRPAQFNSLSSRQSLTLGPYPSRKFSSLPRTASLLSSSCRANPLHAARWRAGATARPNAILTASSIRHGSWYAPWSSAKPSTPAGDAAASGAEQVPIAKFVSDATANAPNHFEPAVTSATPEIAPAGIDKPAFVNSTSDAATTAADSEAAFHSAQSLDELLGHEPAKDIIVNKPEIDPTALIDHAGQLKELGLDYGWGMTTVFERTMEQIYLNSGFGWAGTIMVAGVVVRCATFVFQALSSDKMAALASLKPITQPIQEKMEDAIKRGDKQQEQIYKMQQAQIMAPYMGGIFSMGGFMMAQAWIGFSAFRCLRAMGELPVPGMVHDGLFWFTDLTVRDPYFILPATTTAIFYLIFKTGGETGVDVSSNSTRKKMMNAFALIIGIVTAFQPAALQLYFVVSGILGAGTGWLLRQNMFRRLIHIRPLPSPASNELYSKVVQGEIKLQQIKGKDGKVRYQAPRAPNRPTRRSATTLSGINLKEGSPMPAHLKPETHKIDKENPDRDEDFELGARGSMMEKLDYYRRNYRLAYVSKRMKAGMDKMIRGAGFGGKKMTEEQRKRKARAQEYEIERRRRFQNRS